jgi:DNA repair protein RadC
VKNSRRECVKEPLAARGAITTWPEEERPRERLLRCGPGSLTDAELLAILLRSGSGSSSALDVARGVLDGGGLREMARKNAEELIRVQGVGLAKAVEILAAVEIGRRLQAQECGDRHSLCSPEDAARFLIPRMRDLRHETFVVLVLDTNNSVVGESELSRGTLNASIVHPREVFKFAIDRLAAAVIVAHNHPSGNPEPSREDIEITHQLCEAGKIVGIPLHDHLIVAGNSFTSLAARGYV